MRNRTGLLLPGREQPQLPLLRCGLPPFMLAAVPLMCCWLWCAAIYGVRSDPSGGRVTQPRRWSPGRRFTSRRVTMSTSWCEKRRSHMADTKVRNQAESGFVFGALDTATAVSNSAATLSHRVATTQ
eukprot:3587137-Rhodomonas_salina.1